MKPLLLPILTFFLLTGCATRYGRFADGRGYVKGKIVIPVEKCTQATGTIKQEFSTSFGAIKRGVTKDKVQQILGEPYFSTPLYKGSQVWWYQFSENRRVIIYFIDGRVVEVVEKAGMTSGEI